MYADLSPQISFYRSTSSLILDFTQMTDCDTIIDLGCGSSGLVATKALQKFPALTRIYCIDSSGRMIDECRRRVSSARASFIRAYAEDFDSKVPERVDLVLVNSAFWLFNLSKCLLATHRALKDTGLLVFNFAEWDYEFPREGAEPKYYEAIEKEMAKRGLSIQKRRGSQRKYAHAEINEHLEQSGFKIIGLEEFEIVVERQDWLLFYSIPTIVRRSLPNIPLALAQEIIHSAIMSLSDAEFPALRWIFYKARLNDR